MKKIITTIVITLGFWACTPDYDNILPLVETVDLNSPEDGVILMKGRIADDRGLEVEAAGFCASLDPEPTMEQTQVIGSGSNNDFRGLLYYDEAGVTIYVRTFAVNEYGYSYGDVLSIVTPDFIPPDVPCSEPENTLKDNEVRYNLRYIDTGEVYQVFGAFAIQADSPGPNILIELNRKPRNGTYTTANGNIGDKGADVARVVLTPGFSGPVEVAADQKVYVTKLDNGGWLFEFCDLNYKLNGFNLKASASIRI